MDPYTLDKDDLELFYEILFKKMMDIMKEPKIHEDPFNAMVEILSTMSVMFSFKTMITTVPKLIAYAIRYGMMVQKAYEAEYLDIEEEKQELEEERKKKLSRIKDDIDHISMYL